MEKRREEKAVLVIEDEISVRYFAARVLELEGYPVLQTGDGDEGLRLARENEVALVLLDLRLPGRDGFSVLQEIKSDPELSSIHVIVFTASAGLSQQEKALQMGAADYLVKPLSASSLREAINRILRGKGAG